MKKQKIYFSSTEKTADAWTGGGYLQYLFQINIFGFRIVLWKSHPGRKEDK